MSDVQGKVPDNDPLMIAWNAYKATYEYANSKKWATHIDLQQDSEGLAVVKHLHIEGALWGAFMAGFKAKPGDDHGGEK